jgi:hypothetical protein
MPRVDDKRGRGEGFEIVVDGTRFRAYPGETVAAVLIASGWYRLGESHRRKRARGIYCGMGICYECIMVVNGSPNIRACQTRALPGMIIATQCGLGKIDVES